MVHDCFPEFKSSVVTINGKHCIPHGFSQASNEFRCMGEDPKRPGHPFYFVFEASAIDHCEPFGNLPFGVVGWLKSGRIQVIEHSETSRLYQKPLTFTTTDWAGVLENARANRVMFKPRKRLKFLDKTDTWMMFEAYKFHHWWLGNPFTLRYHAFFRTLRQTPTSSNLVRTGNRVNCVDMRPPEARPQKSG